MSDKISTLEKIGYSRIKPDRCDINDYESLLIKEKNGNTTTLYRLLSKKKEIDERHNFNTSWNVFNSHLH